METKCTCEEDNKLTQAFCKLHGGEAYRTQHTNWGKELGQRLENIYSYDHVSFVKEKEQIFRLFDQVAAQSRKEGSIEHCSEPNCPECNIAAYNAGRKEAVEECIQKIRDFDVTYGLHGEKLDNPVMKVEDMRRFIIQALNEDK